MLIWNWQTDDNNSFRLWPWENERVSTIEYTRSLQNLTRFLETANVSRLQTIEDLSAVASLVGHDIRTLAVATGNVIEKKTEQFEPGVSEPLYSVERGYMLTKFLRDREVSVTASNSHICISEKSSVGFGGYQREELRVSLPADRDIAIGGRPNVDEQSLYAIDLRGGARREYHPIVEPANPEILLGFTHVLQDAVSDILAVLSQT